MTIAQAASMPATTTRPIFMTTIAALGRDLPPLVLAWEPEPRVGWSLGYGSVWYLLILSLLLVPVLYVVVKHPTHSGQRETSQTTVVRCTVLVKPPFIRETTCQMETVCAGRERFDSGRRTCH